MNDHYEFVCEKVDGTMDWVDPVDLEGSVRRTYNEIIVTNGLGFDYSYPRSSVVRWAIRPYSEETTLNRIDSNESN